MAETDRRSVYVDSGERRFVDPEEALAAAVIAEEFAVDPKTANPEVPKRVSDRSWQQAQELASRRSA